MRIEVKKGGGSLRNRWFYRFLGDDVPESLEEGRWSEKGYRTKKEAEAQAKVDADLDE